MTSFGLVFPAANSSGGVERVALQVLEHFAPTRPTTFFGEQIQEPHRQDISFAPVATRSGPRATRPRRFLVAAERALAAGRPDVLLSFGVNCPPGDVYWVHSVHRSWVEHGSAISVKGVKAPAGLRRLMPRHRVLLRLEHEYFTQHRPRSVLCTSPREKHDLQRLYGVPEDVMHVVPNGYDHGRFAPGLRDQWRGQIRARMGLRPDDISLLFVVNELHRKGFAVLLDAVAQVRDERLRIDIVGKAAPAPYRSQIQRLGLAERVHWHGPTADVERYMAAADLLVLPTQYEPFGLVIIEALASGLPVVTTALAGAASAVAPGTGLLQQDPHDAEELADLLRQALEPGVMSAWSAAAPAAAAPYEWSKVLAKAEPLIFNDA